MKNEIIRKITSLTLMTIMFAGGLTFGFAPMVPEAYAQSNANLFISAENSQFDNYMVGAQVVEVVVIDPDIDDTDEGKGEPDVDVNSGDLRMVQAVDGNWYGYFADRKRAQIADETINANFLVEATTNGTGLDFGTFCSKLTTGALIQGLGPSSVSFTQTVGVALQNASGGSHGTVTPFKQDFPDCTVNADPTDFQNVIREEKNINPGTGTATTGVEAGQINVFPGNWPFIQLYDLNPTGSVIIKYNKGGGVQSVTLTFDTVDQFASLELDRTKYPTSTQVHATVTDTWLNIDPTDEDSWTFASNATGTLGTFYQVFDENGQEQSLTDTNMTNINKGTTLDNLMCEDNCVLILDVNTQGTVTDILNLFDNANTDLSVGSSANANRPVVIGNASTVAVTSVAATGGQLGNNTQPLTLTELFASSGTFSIYDENDFSQIETTSTTENRGKSGTLDYNETPQSIVLGFEYATVDIQPIDDEWNSGEEIPMIVVDADANKNSRADEDLDVFSNSVDLIPALATGDPFTLGEAGVKSDTVLQATLFGMTVLATTNFTSPGTLGAGANFTTNVELFSERASLIANASAGAVASDILVLDYKTNYEDFFETVIAPNNAIGITPAGGLTTIDNGGVDGGTLDGYIMYNQDLRGISVQFSDIDQFDIYVVNNTVGTPILTAQGNWTDTNTILQIADNLGPQELLILNDDVVNENLFSIDSSDNFGTLVDFNQTGAPDPDFEAGTEIRIIQDFFSFGFTGDGQLSTERISNQIIRIEAEETGDNTSTFEGSLEYVMVNQLNILDTATYNALSPIADDPTFIVIEDLTDEDSPRVNYDDLDLSGVPTPTSDQEEAPSHSGVVSFDLSSYKVGDTVFITVDDVDLNVDSDLIEIYSTVSPDEDDTDPSVLPTDPAVETVGEVGLPNFEAFALGRLLDITFDDERWARSDVSFNIGTNTAEKAGPTCEGFDANGKLATPDDGLDDTDFTLVESGPATGLFTGDFLIPDTYCARNSGTGIITTVTGKDIEVNYNDFRDASGEIIEVGDSAGVRANTGSVSLDRTVYPVPWGNLDDIGGTTGAVDSGKFSIFPIHATGISLNSAGAEDAGEVDENLDTLGSGDLTIHVRINDPDFDISPEGEDIIGLSGATKPGPVKTSITRGSDVIVLATSGAGSPQRGLLTTGINVVTDDDTTDAGFTAPQTHAPTDTLETGPITEIAPDAGIFELDLTIRYTDGPLSTKCPETESYIATNGSNGRFADATFRFDIDTNNNQNYCILQGDIITVEYTDPTDASGDINTVTDSASFDLRNGVLQSDKSVYIIGADMILTIIDPDWDRDNDSAETYNLDIIEWDSDAADVSMGVQGGEAVAFDPEPSNFRETGDSTGIFQIVIEIPEELQDDRLERGEEIVLEYTDWGPSGSDYVGEEDEDINLTIFTSNFGATVELDQKVFTWTDKVYITIVAPDHNFDSDLIDEIGNSPQDPIKVATRGNNLDRYKLTETGTDTGIFTGEVILTGFCHDADGKSSTGSLGAPGDCPTGDDTNPRTEGLGPTSGFLEASDDDGITVSFEFSEDETVVGSSLIRWNIGETQWLEASYPASGTGVVRVVDPDLNLNPEAVDNFDVDVWSDSDAGGIDLTVTETNEATGIYEGTVFFTTTDESSGHRLRVSEGDTITAEYEDNTLPDPYTRSDELDITGTAIIGTIVPPLERAPAANARVVDAFGNALAEVQVDQQVQITADLANGQDREQSFAYLVQIQDGNGVTVSLAWITGSLSPGQSFSPALSWISDSAGTFTATVFVWQSVDNPTALSPPVSVDIRVI